MKLAPLLLLLLCARPAWGAVPKLAAGSTRTLDLNQATVEQLQALPGIGPVRAQRILARREGRPFRHVGELSRVPGISPRLLSRLRRFVTVAPATSGRPAPIRGR